MKLKTRKEIQEWIKTLQQCLYQSSKEIEQMKNKENNDCPYCTYKWPSELGLWTDKDWSEYKQRRKIDNQKQLDSLEEEIKERFNKTNQEYVYNFLGQDLYQSSKEMLLKYKKIYEE